MKFVTKAWPIGVFFLIWFMFTWPFWLKGLVPAPLDFLVGFFAPWREHYNIPIKNPAIPDVVNQIIPWKIFTIDQWRQGIIPLWNPYNLAGAPHAANWQSAVFYPANLFPLILDFVTGWSLYVLSQPLLAGLFTYLYTRAIKLSKVSSLLAATSFAFSGFMTSWLEWGTLGHAVLWLPASLWAIEKYLVTNKRSYYLINVVTLSLSLLAGHLQVSLYVITVSIVYFYFRSRPLNLGTILKGLTLQGVTPFLLTAFQVFPSIELYFHSVRSETFSPDWFRFFRIPIEYLATFIAPDFFGNPTTRNEWGSGSYVEMMGYVGLLPLTFALTAIFSLKRGPLLKSRRKLTKFFLVIIIVSLLLSLKTPLADIIILFKLPVFASSSPARIIALVSFSLAILAGIGWDKIMQKNTFNQAIGVKIVGLSLALLWLVTIAGPLVFPSSLLAKNTSVAHRNLIVPTVIFLAFMVGSYTLSLLLRKKLPNLKAFLILNSLFVILIISGDLYRFHHKYTPYSSRDYFYPTFGVHQRLVEVAGSDRVFGLFDANLNLPYNVATPEGYDSLIHKPYAELGSAHTTGHISLPDRVSSVQINKNDAFTIPLINLLSVKYIIQPTVHGSAPWELHLWEYPDQFELIFDDGNYQIFTNAKAHPRFSLSGNYEVQTEKDKIISTMLKNKDGHKASIVLDSAPPSPVEPGESQSSIELIGYSPQEVKFSTHTQKNTLLYVADNNYPGWQAQIGGVPTKILNANYTFRAVVVPPGSHEVKFSYNPRSFSLGVVLAGVTLLGLIIWMKQHEA